MSGKAIFAFFAGAAIGSAVTWKLVKTKYEHKADEEIASVREYYAEREKPDQAPEEQREEPAATPTIKRTTEKPDLFEYARQIKESGYVTSDTHETEKGEEGNVRSDVPYAITQDEYGEIDDYDNASLTLYEDGTLVDEWGDVVHNVDELIGPDALTSSDEDPEDVYIRNDLTKTDYEIIRAIGTYAASNTYPPDDDE